MKKLLTLYALAALALSAGSAASGRTPQNSPAQSGTDARPAPRRVIGEVTGVDAAAGRVTIRTDAGETLTVAIDDKTTYMRLPPGETKMERAVTVTREDVRVGDRVLVPDVSPSGGQTTAARRLILMAPIAAAGAQGGRVRDDGRRLNGRVASIDAAKKQIALLTRGRDGIETVTLDAAGDVRVLRFAPDTLRLSEARPSSFADLKVGDQLRATGERASDGARFTPEEIIAGSFTRVYGVVTATDAARGEATIKSEQTGQTVTVTVGKNSTLKRLTSEFVRALEERMQRAEQRGERRASRESGQQGGDNRGERAARRDGGERRGDGAGGRGGGRSAQQMFESLPAVMLADLKKGDAVVVTATTGADDAHITAISLVTGEAEFMRRLQRGTDGAPRGMSPGLPGDILGGGTGGDVRGREQQPPF